MFIRLLVVAISPALYKLEGSLFRDSLKQVTRFLIFSWCSHKLSSALSIASISQIARCFFNSENSEKDSTKYFRKFNENFAQLKDPSN